MVYVQLYGLNLSPFFCQTISSIPQISWKSALQYVIIPHFYAEFENTYGRKVNFELKVLIKGLQKTSSCREAFVSKMMLRELF